MFAFVDAVRPIRSDAWPVIERFVTEPASFVPAPAHSLGEGRWRTDVHAGPLHHEVVLWVGPVWTMPDAWIRPMRWSPTRSNGREGHPLLPDLSGRMALRQSDGLRLELAGHYTPPLGIAGALADGLRLRQVAQATLSRLADDVIRALAEAPPVPAGG